MRCIDNVEPEAKRRRGQWELQIPNTRVDVIGLLYAMLLLSRIETVSAYHHHRSSRHLSSRSPFQLQTSAFAPSDSFVQINFYDYMEKEYRRSNPQTFSTGRLISNRAGFLIMGKGDGKKKRKKKSTAISAPSIESVSSSPAPMRVTNNINVPVRRQIRYAQLNKQYQKMQSTSFRQKKVERTKFRKTWDDEELEQKAEERRKRGQEPDWAVILNRTATSPLVIVDGYNICHKWSRLKKHMAKGDPQRARQLLVDDLENLRSLKGWRVEVVFDGTRKSIVGPLGHGPTGSKIKPTTLDKADNKSVSKHGVRVVFTGSGVEADSYIESRCVEAKAVTAGKYTGSFIVATDDAMIRLAGQNAGALCMSAQRFVDELKAVKKGVEYRVEAAVAKVNGHTVRPEKLRGTYNHRFGRGSIVVEDKRKQRKTHKERREEEERRLEEIAAELDIEVDEDENGVPNWAQIPDQPNRFT